MVASTPDDPDDFERGLFDLERYMSTSVSVPVSAGSKPGKWPWSKGKSQGEAKESKAVAALRGRLDEGRELKHLYDDFLALDVDTSKVFDRKVASVEAAKLHTLSQNASSLALQAAKAKKAVTVMGLSALVLALAWANVNVHDFAATNRTMGDPKWWLAWGIEPFLSLALLSIVGTRAFMAIRGHVVKNRTLSSVEFVLLLLTLGMSVYTEIPAPRGPAAEWSPPGLILAALPPIVAVCIVAGLPILWAEFMKLDHIRTAATLTADHGLTGMGKEPYSLVSSGNADQGSGETSESAVSGEGFYSPEVSKNTDENQSSIVDSVSRHVDDLVARAHVAISGGDLPPKPSAYALRKTLGCGMTSARVVRDRLSPTQSARRG